MFSNFLPERTIVTLGPIAIHWYGLFAAVGALAAYWLIRRLGRIANLADELTSDAFFVSLIVGLIGARLWHVIGDFGYYGRHLVEIPAIWNGGLAFHGGLVAGGLTLFLLSRRKQVSFLLLTDLFAPALALAEGIGRWGNYFNQELFGRPTNLPWGIPVAPQLRPPEFLTASRFHPTFLYESVGLLLVAALLTLFIRWRSRPGSRQPAFLRVEGGVFALFLVLTGALRVAMEQFRVDAVLTVSGVRVPLLVSIAVVIVGLVLFRRLALSERRPSVPPA